MGFRFRKRISILGGLVVFNLGNGGYNSTSIKICGITFNTKTKKATVKTGIPGLHYQVGGDGADKRVSVDVSQADIDMLKQITGSATNVGAVRIAIARTLEEGMKNG